MNPRQNMSSAERAGNGGPKAPRRPREFEPGRDALAALFEVAVELGALGRELPAGFAADRVDRSVATVDSMLGQLMTLRRRAATVDTIGHSGGPIRLRGVTTKIDALGSLDLRNEGQVLNWVINSLFAVGNDLVSAAMTLDDDGGRRLGEVVEELDAISAALRSDATGLGCC